MDPATIALITAIIGLIVRFLPDLETIGREIITLYQSGSSLSADDLAKIQAFTDTLVERGLALEAKILQQEVANAAG